MIKKILLAMILYGTVLLGNNVQYNAVNRHNAIRLEVFTDSQMQWNDKLALSAQKYAKQLATSGKFEHDLKNEKFGENLYAASYSSATYIEAINSWYEEKKDYDYASNSCSTQCGHYTQIVWKQTTEVGCGKAIYSTGDFKGGVVIVCRYNPAGNYRGERPY